MDAGAPYRIDYRREVKQQLRELARRATVAGIRDQYLEVLNETVDRLSRTPHELGDPRHNLKHEGGVAYYALRPPVLVFYVTFEVERLVVILDVKPAPGSPLDVADEG
jgi:hypothetical protein